MIELKDIYKSYFSKNKVSCILEKASLTISDKDFIYIVGKSGAGKSTLLNILALFDTFEKGEYFLNGENITRIKKDYPSIRNKMFGFVFQSYNLIEDLSVRENIALPLLYSDNCFSSEERVVEIADRLGISILLDKKVSFLSGGEKQRVAFARAVINNPKYIFCDEPTGNLDMDNSKAIIDLLHEENEKGTTIIVVTHDMDLVKSERKTTYEIKEKNIVRIS